MTPEDKRLRLAALTRLALATREKAEPQVFQVYLEALSGWSADTLTEACRRLQTSATWFPKVAEISEACTTVANERHQRDEQRRLSAHLPDPISPERHAEIMAQFRAVLKRKVMP